MASRVTFYLAADLPSTGGDPLNDWLQASVFAAAGGPFEIASRERSGVPGVVRVTLAGTVPAPSQAGITTALEASPYCAGEATWDEV